MKKLLEGKKMWLTVGIVVACVIAGVGSWWFSGTPDGAIEEMCEAIVEQQIGLPDGSIDLSPSSPEEK